MAKAVESSKLSPMYDPLDKTRRPPFIRAAQSVVRWFFRIFMMAFRIWLCLPAAGQLSCEETAVFLFAAGLVFTLERRD